MDPLLLDSPNTNYSNYTPSFTDDLVFILNNLVDDNLEAKLPAIRSIFFQGGWPFVEQFVPYFVLRRIAYEANRHLLYFRMLSGLDLPTFHTTLFEPVLLFTTKAFKVYLENEAKSFDTHERSVLKNLGSWLGLITFPRNRFLNIDSPDEINFIEVLGKERGDVLSIMIPAVCQFVSFADLKNPKNPSWVQELLRGLELCMHIADLGMKAKFEIEAVFAKVGQPLMLGSPVECSPLLPPDEKVKQNSASPIPAPDFETKGIFSPLDNNGNLSKNERQISLSVRKVFNLSIEQCESIGTAFSDFTILHSLPPILNADAYKFLVVHSMQMIIDSASFKAKEAIEKLANSAESPVAGNIKTIQNYFNDLLFRPVSLAITQYLTKQTFEQCLRTNLEHYIFQCKVILPHDSIEAIISNLTIYNLTNVLEYSANVVCKEVVKMIGKLAQDLCARNDGKYSTHNLYARYLLPQNADCFNYFRGSINPENFRFAMPGFSQNDDHLIFRNLGAFSTNLVNICNDLKGFVNTAMTAHKDHYFFELGKLVQTFLSSEPKTVQIIKKFVSTTIFFVLTAHNVSSSIVHKDKSQLIATFHHIMDILLQNFSDKFIREITTGVVLQHSDVGIVNQEVFLLLFKKQCINCAEVDRVIVDKMQRRDASAREFARFLQKTFGPQRVDEFFQGFPGVYNFLVTTLREF